MKPLRTIALALVAGVLAVSSVAVPDAEATSPADTLGVYVGAGNVSQANRFGSWLGNPMDRALDFVDGSSWSTISSPTWSASVWRSTGYRMDFSIPMFPDSGGSLTTGASGGYNAHWVRLGQTMVANGHANAIIRPGWEFNGDWFRWAGRTNPAAYAGYFRQIVTAMRGVPGQRFEFEWNPALGKPAGWNAEEAYPGDAYVDYIGLDVYDNSWIPNYRDPVARWNDYMNTANGLRWHRDFSAQHGKPMTFPEWGIMTRADGHGGGDTPYFIERMHDWIRQNNVAGHYYFEFDAPDGHHELMSGEFPQSASKFRELFRSDASAPPPPPNPTPTPPPPPNPAPTPPPPTTPMRPANQAPTISLLRPTAGLAFTNRLTITADATDDRRVDRVEIFVDGRRVAIEYNSPYSINWRARRVSYGRHTVTVRAYDDAGLSSADSVSVTRVRSLRALSANRLAKIRAIRRG